MSEQDQGCSQWCIVELMGHRRLGGFVSEAEIAGARLLRIEIPTPDGAFVTQFYGPQSIYCLTPTTEDSARAVALRNQPEPMHPWEVRLLESRCLSYLRTWMMISNGGADHGNRVSPGPRS